MATPMIYYTKCREGKHVFFAAIEADSEEKYQSELHEFLESNPTVKAVGYEVKTIQEYHQYLRGY